MSENFLVIKNPDSEFKKNVKSSKSDERRLISMWKRENIKVYF
jgi:hypothetical protein